MVRKLTYLICFDILQSKRYQNALVGARDDKTNSEKKVALANTICLIEKCQIRSRISVLLAIASKAHTKSNFSSTPAMFKEPLQLNSH